MNGEEARDKYFLSVEKKYEKEVAALWRESLSQIRNEMAVIFEKYSTNGLLTKAEMTKYNRLAALEKKIQEMIKPAIAGSKKIIERLKPEEYGEAFFRTAWAFDNNARVALDWGPLDKPAIAASLDNVFHEVAVENWGQEALNRIRTTISNGLATGQSYPDMMKDVKGFVNMENFKIMRILRTELHDAQEAGSAQAYEDAVNQGIAGKVIWIATLDDRTRDSHADMDGEAQNEDGMFILNGKNGTYETPYPGYEGLPPEERINCRCTTRFEVEGFEPEVRRSRDEGVIPYQTYSDWKDDHKTFD
jgi:SPP1 gp7 family putative phage head morphogenesis protein